MLDRLGLHLRSSRVQQFSPDPEYASKLIDLEMALGEARHYPRSMVAVFLDEMGFSRWPDRCGANNGLWRLIGGLNALTGQVNYSDGYLVGRANVIEFYG